MSRPGWLPWAVTGAALTGVIVLYLAVAAALIR